MLLDIDIKSAFKIIDNDFDGNIGMKDLKHFLIETIHIPEEEITETKLARLYKLLDLYKRGRILCSDFERILLGFDS